MGSSDRFAVNLNAAALVAELQADPDGMVSPSVYETGRLVTLAPGLAGHRERVRFLLDEQSPQGRWGAPDGYHLVPTLSAVEALLGCLLGNAPRGVDTAALIDATDRGLRALFGAIDSGEADRHADTIAAELIIPALVSDVNDHLDRVERQRLTGLETWHAGRRLPLPGGTEPERLDRLRRAALAGHPVPAPLHHSLEVLGSAARAAGSVRPARGSVGCSPAATAASLGAGHPDHPAVRHLEELVRRFGGPVPVVFPIDVFEHCWVLAGMSVSGLVPALPAGTVTGMLRRVHGAFGAHGVGAGAGLPADADDTAVALHVLARLGAPRAPDCLEPFRAGDHFCTFPGERNPSTSTNAHVLQAFGSHQEFTAGTGEGHHHPTLRRLTGWLVSCQEPEGHWWDKWHASPYYATACCVVALARYGGPAGAPAVGAAVRWLLDTQRADGSWGRWGGTHEETAYAVQALLLSGAPRDDRALEQAVARGAAFLQQPLTGRQTALWHGKDLYTPIRVVRAERLAALRLARTLLPRAAEPADAPTPGDAPSLPTQPTPHSEPAPHASPASSDQPSSDQPEPRSRSGHGAAR